MLRLHRMNLATPVTGICPRILSLMQICHTISSRRESSLRPAILCSFICTVRATRRASGKLVSDCVTVMPTLRHCTSYRRYPTALESSTAGLYRANSGLGRNCCVWHSSRIISMPTESISMVYPKAATAASVLLRSMPIILQGRVQWQAESR